MGSFRDDDQLVQNIYMSFLPIPLLQLLASPHFTPHPISSDTPEGVCKLQEEQFITIAKSLMFQVLCAVAFLHDTARKIAHRDIKPGNIMFSKEGCVKLIDFGISFKNEPDTEKIHDLWPESQNRLYFEVSTGWIRPSKLLFGDDYLIVPLEKTLQSTRTFVRNTDLWPPRYWSLEPWSNFFAVLHAPTSMWWGRRWRNWYRFKTRRRASHTVHRAKVSENSRPRCTMDERQSL